MRLIVASAALLLLLTGSDAAVQTQGKTATTGGFSFRVVLLGTRSGPSVDAQRFGISTLIVAGPEKLLFDCGRSLTTGMARLAINPADVTKGVLTHLHPDPLG